MASRPPFASSRLASLRRYPFEEIDVEVERLRDEGVRVLDLGVGDFTDETPEVVRDACRLGVERHRAAGYPPGAGLEAFREEAAAWIARRYGVTVDPRDEVTGTGGSKEAVFHLPLALLDPGDRVLAPDPGYPPVTRGTWFAGGEVLHYPLREETGFLPDLDALASLELDRVRVFWICTPNNPTGKVTSAADLDRFVSFARARGWILCSDEAYGDLWFEGGPPPSVLEVGREGILAFFSLSKRSVMTSYRVGFAAGDARLVHALRDLKANLDSGVPPFVQEGAIAALRDEEATAALRDRVRERRDLLACGLEEAGLEPRLPEGGLYVWQKVPPGWTSLRFFRRLLASDLAIVCLPGEWLCESEECPGRGYVRFSLGAATEDVAEASRRLAALGRGAWQ